MKRFQVEVRRHLRLIAMLTLLVVAGCTQEPNRSATPHPIVYHLDWTWGKAAAAPSGGWDVQNDLGFRVHVSRGYLTSYSMELVECSKVQAPPPGASSSLLLPLLGIGTAYAGHSTGTPNPVAIAIPRVESLATPQPSEAKPPRTTTDEYCRAYYLVARATNTSEGLPADVDMVDASLHIDGTYSKDTAAPSTAFSVHTGTANGVLAEIYPPGAYKQAARAFRFSTGDSAAQVMIRRNLGVLFDGIDFGSASAKIIERQILKNLIDATVIEVEVGR